MHIHSWLPSYEEWRSSIHANGTSFPYMTNAMDQNELATDGTSTIGSKTPLDMLYEEGKDYLYGLLCRESIQLGSWWNRGSISSRDPDTTTVLWYDDSKFESSFSQNVSQCLEPVLFNATGPCQIIRVVERDSYDDDRQELMSHFPACTVSSIVDKDDTKFLPQHRLWHSLSMSRDLIGASAFVGPRHSVSSDLFRERIVFQRRELVWKLGRIPPVAPELVICDY